MKTKYFIVKKNDLEFRATISFPEKVYKEATQQYIIEFGGHRKCIIVTIYDQEPEGWLTGLKHHADCASNKKLLKGDDGTVVMLKSALQFAKRKFPFLQMFKFVDNSYVKLSKDVRIKLPVYYLVKHKKTWYQEKIGARVEDDKHQAELENMNHILDDASYKVSSYETYDVFFKKCILLSKEDILESLFDELQNNREIHRKFDDCKTIREFLLYLDATYQVNIFHVWLERFISLSFDSQTWIIDCATLEGERITIRKTEAFSYYESKGKITDFSSLPIIYHRGGYRLELDMKSI